MIKYFKPFEGRFFSLEDIYMNVNADEQQKKRIRMAITRLIKSGKVFRSGRGIYGFFEKTSFLPEINKQTEKLTSNLSESFPYLDYSITDTSILSEFMNLQPFSVVILIETQESAVNPIISSFQNSGITAFTRKDYPKIEKYINNDVLILVQAMRAINPAPIKNGKIKFTCLEKILVDLVCDNNIFAQYQGTELVNIYQNATAKYAVNYSKLLKYAKARNRKADCIAILETTDEYPKVRDIL